MFEFVKRLLKGGNPPDSDIEIAAEDVAVAVAPLDPAELVDEILRIRSSDQLGDATAALEEHGELLVEEVAARLRDGRLSPPNSHAAAIWLAHHTTQTQFAPFLEEQLLATLNHAIQYPSAALGLMLPATMDAIGKLDRSRRAPIAIAAFSAAPGTSDVRFRLLKLDRSDELVKLAKEAIAGLERQFAAVATAAFRTSFEREDLGVLLRHYEPEHPSAEAFVTALGKIADPRCAPILAAAAEDKRDRVASAAKHALFKRQDTAESAVVEMLSSRRKAARIAAGEVLAKWERNARIDTALREALAAEKYDDVKAVLQPMAPMAGEIGFASLSGVRDGVPAELRSRVSAAVRTRLGGAAIDWNDHRGDLDALVAVVASELEGSPSGADNCMAVLAEVLDIAADSPLAPWASAWFLRSMKSLYSGGRELPLPSWQHSHARFREAGLRPLIELLLQHDVHLAEGVIAWALGFYGDAKAFVALLRHDGAGFRRRAVEMLAARPFDGLAEAGAELLDDSRKDVRITAVELLTLLGGTAAIPALEARLARERAKDVRKAIQGALTTLRLSSGPDVADMDAADIDARLAAVGATPLLDLDGLSELRWRDGEPLSAGAFAWFVSALEQYGHRERDEILESLREQIDPVAAKHLLLALRERFADADEARIGWVLYATAILGDDNQVATLGAGLDEEARFGSSAQAFRHLDVLERIGSNAAIGWLDHWARKAKSRGLRGRARDGLARLARARGVSGEDLADLAFGDYGLDEHGNRTFTVGDRAILARFDATGEVGVVREDGTIEPRFPAQRATDDADEYERVRDEYRAWRKALKRALDGQRDRLEWAMVWGREWTRDAFLASYAAHPVLGHLAQGILWRVGNTIVRFGDDHAFSTIDDEPFGGPIESIAVAHPVDFAAGDAERWHDIFVDYLLVAPFSQLDRPVREPTLSSTSDLEFEAVEPEPMRRRMLDRGWLRGEVEDHGIFYELEREHPNGIVAHALLDPGLYVAADSMSDDQRVRIGFTRGGAVLGLGAVPRALLAEITLEVLGPP